MRFAPVIVTGLLLATPPAGQGGRVSQEVPVRISTSFGDIDIVADVGRAPVTAKNFLRYVDAGLYDGGEFYRVTRQGTYTPHLPNRPMMNLIEGRLSPANQSKGFPPIPLEPTSITGLKHVVGTVSMGREGPDTATSDFFILLDDQPSLDFGGRRFDDAQGAAAFGHVVAGLDVVKKIHEQGPMQTERHDYLATPVPIASVRRR